MKWNVRMNSNMILTLKFGVVHGQVWSDDLVWVVNDLLDDLVDRLGVLQATPGRGGQSATAGSGWHRPTGCMTSSNTSPNGTICAAVYTWRNRPTFGGTPARICTTCGERKKEDLYNLRGEKERGICTTCGVERDRKRICTTCGVERERGFVQPVGRKITNLYNLRGEKEKEDLYNLRGEKGRGFVQPAGQKN